MMMMRLLLLLAALCPLTVANAQEARLERGRYLVEAVMACDGCHTPPGPGGADMEQRFSGGPQVWNEPAYLVRGSNISQDKDTGVGAWSEADWKRLMVEGKRPNGVRVAPQMPFPFYQVLTPGDLDAVVAYMRTAKPVNREIPAPVYKQEIVGQVLPGGEKPFSEADLGDKLKRGFYLATIAHCMECHARPASGPHDFKGNLGKGGYVMKGPFGEAIVSNITSHPERGIGKWSDGEIKRALTEGVGRDGRAFKQPMARQRYFAKMTPDDIDAIVAWVRTIPPLE